MGRIRSLLNIVVDSSFYALLFSSLCRLWKRVVGEEEDVPLIQLLHDMPWCLKFVIASDTDMLSCCYKVAAKKILHWFALSPYSFEEKIASCFNLNKLCSYVLWAADFVSILQKCAWLAIDWILIFCLGTMLVARPFLFFQVPHLLLPQYTV